MGDDLFKQVITNLLDSVTLNGSSGIEYEFADPVTIKSIDSLSDKGVTHIILGAGDVLTNYFLEPLRRLVIRTNFVGPMFALGVGIPFPSEMIECALNWDPCYNMFDEIVFRSENDLQIGDQIMINSEGGTISMCPDLSSVLYETSPKSNKNKESKIKAIGVNFPMDLAYTMTSEKYNSLTTHLAEYLSDLPFDSYKLYFLNFRDSESVSDEKIHTDIAHKLKLTKNSNYELKSFKGVDETLEFIASNLDIGIGARYHFCLFFALSHVPILPVCMTRKMYNLCQRTMYLELPTQNHIPGMPLTGSLNLSTWKTVTEQFIEQRFEVLNHFCDYFGTETKRIVGNKLQTWLSRDQRNLSTRTQTKARLKIQNAVEKLNQYRDESYELGLTAKLVLQSLIDTHEVDFLWGLTQKMKGDSKRMVNWYDELSYVWKKHYIDMFNGKLKKPHRHGWSWVMNMLKPLQNDCEEKGIRIIDYVDKTFGWDYDYNEYTKSLPQEKWLGIVHHTFDESEDNNLTKVFENPTFLTSLSKCVGLVVFSQYLKEQIVKHLYSKGLGPLGVRVFSVYHPAPTPTGQDTFFEFDDFVKNPRVFQIGKFLRNTFAIYALESSFPKFVLCGHNMSDIALPTQFSLNCQWVDEDGHYQSKVMYPGPNANPNPIRHKFMDEFSNHVSKLLTNVERIDEVSDVEYDSILASSVIFLNLIDASAVNTVIECFVRNTPILLNHHPALVELLGDEYPFFYKTIAEASVKVSDTSLIKATTEYMKAMRKDILDFERFENTLRNIADLKVVQSH